MSLLDVIIIGIGLSMDAVCVSISNGMCMKNIRLKHAFANSFFFGAFQGIMPIIGFFAGSLFVGFFSQYSYIIVSAIFLILGGKMLFDAFKNDEEETECKLLTPKLLLIQAIATSIDALAVGVSFSALQVEIFSSASIIALTTFVLSFLAITIGKKIGHWLENKAEILGGILLVGIALKVLIEGLM